MRDKPADALSAERTPNLYVAFIAGHGDAAIAEHGQNLDHASMVLCGFDQTPVAFLSRKSNFVWSASD